MTSYLNALQFKTNPYDWCVANKTINGKQCTILWHVDDIKLSHVDGSVLEDIISELKKRYGKDALLTVTRGRVHDYLGMTIDYQEDGKVKFTMIDYIENMLNEVPGDISGESATPAGNHLFKVNIEPELLNEADSEMFHHYVAKLLFLSKRARPDIQTATAFLTTRVKRPETDDYKKLARVMKYLRGTINLPLTLEANDAHVLKWWVDGSFAVHSDMKSHTGVAMSIGAGATYAGSRRQRLNTKSSTEAELVAVDDAMPQVLWIKYFLESQGYHVNKSVIYQDNQSAMLLEKNGRGSSGKRTRHINIRYCFVTDRIKSKEVIVEYCPTAEMLGDFFTKPLQGSLFKKLRDRVLNIRG